ncbi:hypothetical protein MRX96_012177 [Rhipicephalus microplus]
MVDDALVTTTAMTTLSQPTTKLGTSSMPFGTTDTTAPSGDITGSSKASGPPVPAERCSKLTGSLVPLPRHPGRRATSELSGEGDGSVSGRESAGPTSPNKELLAHWEKVFGRVGLETSANKSEEGERRVRQQLPKPREASSATARRDVAGPGASTSRSADVAGPELRVVAVEKSEQSLMIELHSVPLKSGTGHIFRDLPQAQKRDKKGPRRESLGLKRTAAVGNLVERDKLLNDPGKILHPRSNMSILFLRSHFNEIWKDCREAGTLNCRCPSLQVSPQETRRPIRPASRPRDVLTKARETAKKQEAPSSRRSSKDRSRKRVLPMSSHPAPRTPTFRYYMSHSSLSSDKRTPHSSSPNVSTHGKEYYKGYLHAGKVLPSPGGVSDAKLLPSSFPILEERDAQKQLAEDGNNVPPVEHHAAPVPKDRKISAP